MGTANLFSCYLMLQQLPDDTKSRHGIKVGAKTPRYDLTAMAGYYKPLDDLKTKKGQIVFYLNETRGVITSPDNRRADRFLMGKNSINFSSVFLLDYSPDATLYGFGNPNPSKTIGKDERPNPFADCKDDGYLFIISPDWLTIEVLVVPNGVNTILGNAKALADGVYNEALQTMRATAKTFYQY